LTEELSKENAKNKILMSKNNEMQNNYSMQIKDLNEKINDLKKEITPPSPPFKKESFFFIKNS
jgi:hypothetical protein